MRRHELLGQDFARENGLAAIGQRKDAVAAIDDADGKTVMRMRRIAGQAAGGASAFEEGQGGRTPEVR